VSGVYTRDQESRRRAFTRGLRGQELVFKERNPIARVLMPSCKERLVIKKGFHMRATSTGVGFQKTKTQ
jgi:hypothetical protein